MSHVHGIGMSHVHGIHHVTCIAGDPQENLDFYTGVLGLRLVKKSVNQDVPNTYHLFYADAAGTPGTDLTFFPWPDMPPARAGIGLAMEVAFAIRPGSLAWWQAHLAGHDVAVEDAETRFGEPVLTFRDPHGLPLALVETTRERPWVAWDRSAVPVDHQLRGMDAVRLWQRDRAECGRFLQSVLGMERVGEEDGWERFAVPGRAAGTIVDVREVPGMARGAWGTGGIHHVAWRVPDDAAELLMRERVESAGRRPTPPIDRFWFRSVYFLEPGGVLFELATDGPGFARDEAADQLGELLILPPWLEASRAEIEAALPPLTTPREA